MRTQEQVNGMLCPVCTTGLALADRGGVEIDYCPTCRGVWLDRGELDKIIERDAAPARSEPNRSDDRDRYDRDRYDCDLDDDDDDDRRYEGGRRTKRRRESLLSELFDF